MNAGRLVWSALLAGALAACGPGASPGIGLTQQAAPAPSASPSRTSAGADPTDPTFEQATPTSVPVVETTYLALGDSLAVGVGATDPGRSGYVARIHAALDERDGRDGRVTLRNLAVSGETSRSIIDGGQLAAAVEVIRASAPPVGLVTIDIGGNDLLRLLGSDPCASAPDGVECRQAVAATLADFERNLGEVLGRLRSTLDASAPEARLAIITYFNPFSGTSALYEAAGQLALLGADAELDCAAATVLPEAKGMNDVIACAAAEAGALLVDVEPAFTGLGLELTHIGNEDIHANDAGYALIADALRAALDR